MESVTNVVAPTLYTNAVLLMKVERKMRFFLRRSRVVASLLRITHSGKRGRHFLHATNAVFFLSRCLLVSRSSSFY